MFNTENILKQRMGLSLLVCLVFFALGFTGPIVALAAGPAPVNLLSAGNFAILSETGITDTGSHASVIIGNIGSSPITAFAIKVWCSEIAGTIYGVNAAYVGSGITTCFAGNPPLANKTLVDNAVLDMGTAYGDAAGRALPDGTNLYGGNLGGQTFAPGLYKWTTDVTIPTNVTLSGGANDVWIFQIAGDLSIDSGGSVPAGIKVLLTGGAQASNVFWQVGGPTGATLKTYSTFNGTILSAKQIILQTGAVLNGAALAQTQVTLDANVVTENFPSPPSTAPALVKAFSPATINAGAGNSSTLTITLSNPNSVATLSALLIDTLPTNVTTVGSPTTTCGGPSPTATTSSVTLPLGATIPGGSIATPGTCTVTVNVTAPTAGSYVNTLAAGALQTSQGSNANPAITTLTVNPQLSTGAVAPTVSKSFNPTTISAVGTSTLTIILSNSSNNTDDTSTTFTDNLPTGLVIATPPNGTTSISCGVGATLTALAGTGTIVLSGATIPKGVGSTPGTCTVTVNVTAPLGGSFNNTLAAGAVLTVNGSSNNSNTGPAIATLIGDPPVPASVPTLNEWGMMIFIAVAGLGAVYYLRRQKVTG